MKASIIIITYNQASTIARAIESVLRQVSPYPFEIIIADDDSSDSTRDIAEHYARLHPDIIRLLPSHPNRGLVDNYFEALKHCRGEYIGDCAGDDEWLDQYRLARQIAVLDSDSTLSAVFSDVEEVRILPDGTTQKSTHSSDPRRRRWMLPRIPGRELLIGVLNHTTELPFTLSAALYRKSIVDNMMNSVPQFIRMPEMGIEDVPIMAALAASGDITFLPGAGYRYYISGESISNNLSYEKEYNFYSRDTRGTALLADHYGIDRQLLRDHYRNKLNHISAQARHAHRRDLIPEIKRTAREYWHTRLPIKACLNLLLLRIK